MNAREADRVSGGHVTDPDPTTGLPPIVSQGLLWCGNGELPQWVDIYTTRHVGLSLNTRKPCAAFSSTAARAAFAGGNVALALYFDDGARHHFILWLCGDNHSHPVGGIMHPAATFLGLKSLVDSDPLVPLR
jgi:hypothetical protein